MAYRVNILDLAIEDIVGMISYARARWGDDLAEQTYLALMDKLELLCTQPFMGSEVPELVDAGYVNFRMLVHEAHTKFLYEFDEKNKVIHIHLVYGSKQDFQTLLYNRIIRYQ